KLMRIDVDRTEGELAYAIPPDNPFLGKEGVRPEIWASGFREPYRLSWDSKTGDLWVGDVGQDRIEEVAIVRGGENHGWNVYEGHQLFSELPALLGERPNTTTLVVAEDVPAFQLRSLQSAIHVTAGHRDAVAVGIAHHRR